LRKLPLKTFLTLCKTASRILFWHLIKNASKNFAGAFKIAFVQNIIGTFENCREILFPTPLNVALFILPLKDFSGSLVAFVGTLKCQPFEYLT
jgi:hypothetical protein